MLLLLLAVEGNRMEIEYLCITYVKFICLLLINLLNAAAFSFFRLQNLRNMWGQTVGTHMERNANHK